MFGIFSEGCNSFETSYSQCTSYSSLNFYFAFLFSLLQHYSLKYRCDDCLYNPYGYRSIYDFNQTSVNLTVHSGAAYTVWIRVYTRYGYGKWAQTSAVTQASLGPVTNLMAQADGHNPNLAHVTWGPPRNVQSPILVSNIDEFV